MSNSSSFFALEPRIMFDGAMAGDVADNVSDNDDVSVTPEPNQETAKRVVLISDDVKDHRDLADAVEDDVIAVIYDADGSLDDILSQLKNTLDGQKIDTLALASHGGSVDGSFYVNDTLVSLQTLAADAEVKGFFKQLGSMIKEGGRLDVLACNFAETQTGRLTHALLSDLVGRDVTASTDKTGNAKDGGDWDQEIGNVDVSSYFDETRLEKFDGTLAGPYLKVLKDINGTDKSSSITFLTELNGKLVFTARDKDEHSAIWVSDGTEAGTVQLVDLNVGGSDQIAYPTKVGDYVVFSAKRTDGSVALYSTDGTAAGTKEIHAFSSDTYMNNIVVDENSNTLYFSNDDKTWRTDGTAAGTEVFHSTEELDDLTFVGGKIYGTYFGADRNTRIVVSDGASDSFTEILTADKVDKMHAFGTKLAFYARSDTHGTGLFLSDGTPGGTTLIKALPANGYNAVQRMDVIGDKLFFTYNGGSDTGTELWVSDGTDAGTKLFKDINPGSRSSYVNNGDQNDYSYIFTEFKGKYYFSAETKDHGKEVWVTDGTAEGTKMLKDIKVENDFPYNSVSSSPRYFKVFNDRLYFSARGDGTGTELWSTDGTEEGTRLEVEGQPGADRYDSDQTNSPRYEDGASPNKLTVLNGKLFMVGTLYNAGREVLVLGDERDNNAPYLELSTYPTNYTIDRGHKISVSWREFRDGDYHEDWNGGTVKFELVENDEATDVLSLSLSSSYEDFSISGTEIRYKGTLVATVNSAGAEVTNGNSLIFTFNENANNAIVERLMRKVAFSMSTDKPATLDDRKVKITATDALGAASNVDWVIDINRSPTFTNMPNRVTYVDGENVISLIGNGVISDPDGLEDLKRNNWDTIKLEVVNDKKSSGMTFVLSDNDRGLVWERPNYDPDNPNSNANGVIKHGETVIAETSRFWRGSSDGFGDNIEFTADATTDDISAVLSSIAFDKKTTDTKELRFKIEIRDNRGGFAEHEMKAGPKLPVEITSSSNKVVFSNGRDTSVIALPNAVVEGSVWDGGTLKFQLTAGANAADRLFLPTTGPNGIFVDGLNVMNGSTVIGTIDVSGGEVAGDGAMTVTFNASANSDVVQNLVRSLSFKTTASSTDGAARELTVSAVDGDANTSNTVKSLVVNEPAVLNVSDGTLKHSVGGDANVVDENATISDPDNGGDWSGTKLSFEITSNASSLDKLAINFSNSSEYRFSSQSIQRNDNGFYRTIATVNSQSVSGGTNLVVTLNGQATNADAQNILRALEYRNTGSDTPNADRVITIKVIEANGAETTDTKNVTFNAKPIVSIPDSEKHYTFGSTPVKVAPNLTLNDPDGDADWNGGQLKISDVSGGKDGDELSFVFGNNSGLSISGSNVLSGTTIIGTINQTDGIARDTGQLVITFNASATNALVQELAQATSYRSILNTRNGVDPHITIEATDRSGALHSDSQVVKINFSPVVSVPSPDVGRYQPGRGSMPLGTGLSVTDNDSNGNWENSTLRVQIGQTGAPTDTVKILEGGPRDIRVEGTQLYAGSVLIGKVNVQDGRVQGGDELVVTFNDQATVRLVQAVARSLAFENPDKRTTGGVRDVSITITDSAGGETTVERSIDVRVAKLAKPAPQRPSAPLPSLGEGTAPTIVTRDPVLRAEQGDGAVDVAAQATADVVTTIRAEAQRAIQTLGSDGGRTFIAGAVESNLGSEGERTILRIQQDATESAIGDDFTRSTSDGLNAILNSISAPTADGLIDSLGDLGEENEEQTDLLGLQAQRQGEFSGRASFSAQLANGGSMKLAKSAASLENAHNTLARLKTA